MQIKKRLAALIALALTAVTATGQTSYFGPPLPVTNITVNGNTTIDLKWDDYTGIIGFKLYTTTSLDAPDWQPMTETQTGLTRMGTDATVFALANTGVNVPGNSPTDRQFYRLIAVKGEHTCPAIVIVGEGEDKVYYIQVDKDPDVYLEVGDDGNAKKPLTYWKNIRGTSRTQVWEDGEGGWTTDEPDTGCTCEHCDCDNPEGCQCFIVGGDNDEFLFQRVGDEEFNGKQVRVRLTNPGKKLADRPPTYWVWDDGNDEWKQVWQDNNGDWHDVGTWDVGDGKLGSYEQGKDVGNKITLPTPEPSDGVNWTYELESGELPFGLTLNSDGTITGEIDSNATPGDYPFTVKATPDNDGDSISKDFTITVTTPVCGVCGGDHPTLGWKGVDHTIKIDLTTTPSTVTKYTGVDKMITPDSTGKTTSLWMRYINPGCFTIGTPVSEQDFAGAVANETAQSRILSGYYIGVYQLTEQQYNLIMGDPAIPSNPNYAKVGNSTDNSEPMSWNHSHANLFVALNSKVSGSGLTFNFPSEAQWEFACRAGTRDTFNDGNGPIGTEGTIGIVGTAADNLNKLGWFADNNNSTPPHLGVKEVGLKAANLAGLYDMHGNVWEWCLDQWDGSTAHVLDLTPDYVSGNGSGHPVRGGYFYYPAAHCRSAYRLYSMPSRSYGGVGLRLAASGAPVP